MGWQSFALLVCRSYYARKQAKQALEAQKKSEISAGGGAAIGSKPRSVFDDEHGDYIIR